MSTYPIVRRLASSPAGCSACPLAWCSPSIWLFGAADVALAVTAVFAGLVAVLLAGAPGWRPFAVGLLAGAVVAGGALLALGWLR